MAVLCVIFSESIMKVTETQTIKRKLGEVTPTMKYQNVYCHQTYIHWDLIIK